MHIYIYVYIYTPIYIYVCMYICIYVCVCLCVWVCIINLHSLGMTRTTFQPIGLNRDERNIPPTRTQAKKKSEYHRRVVFLPLTDPQSCPTPPRFTPGW